VIVTWWTQDPNGRKVSNRGQVVAMTIDPASHDWMLLVVDTNGKLHNFARENVTAAVGGSIQGIIQ
jgi:hypothetical protein